MKFVTFIFLSELDDTTFISISFWKQEAVKLLTPYVSGSERLFWAYILRILRASANDPRTVNQEMNGS